LAFAGELLRHFATAWREQRGLGWAQRGWVGVLALAWMGYRTTPAEVAGRVVDGWCPTGFDWVRYGGIIGALGSTSVPASTRVVAFGASRRGVSPGDVVHVPGARGGCHDIASRPRQQFRRTYSASTDARVRLDLPPRTGCAAPTAHWGVSRASSGSTPPRRQPPTASRRPYRLFDSGRSRVNVGGVASAGGGRRCVISFEFELVAPSSGFATTGQARPVDVAVSLGLTQRRLR